MVKLQEVTTACNKAQKIAETKEKVCIPLYCVALAVTAALLNMQVGIYTCHMQELKVTQARLQEVSAACKLAQEQTQEVSTACQLAQQQIHTREMVHLLFPVHLPTVYIE